MPNKQYQQGYSFENRIVRKLINEQKSNCWRSAGSHSPVDITFVQEDCIYLIQCKHTKFQDINLTVLLADDNILKFEMLPCPVSTVKVLAIKQARSKDVIQLVYNTSLKKWQLNSALVLK